MRFPTCNLWKCDGFENSEQLKSLCTCDYNRLHFKPSCELIDAWFYYWFTEYTDQLNGRRLLVPLLCEDAKSCRISPIFPAIFNSIRQNSEMSWSFASARAVSLKCRVCGNGASSKLAVRLTQNRRYSILLKQYVCIFDIFGLVKIWYGHLLLVHI